MNTFLTSPRLTQLTTSHPATEFRVSPRPNHHPILKATYINGRIKSVCVRNMSPELVMKRAEMLLKNDGSKNKRLGSRKVVSQNENVRGIWSPMHGGLKMV
jgi:large subunit ribosomal protein L43